MCQAGLYYPDCIKKKYYLNNDRYRVDQNNIPLTNTLNCVLSRGVFWEIKMLEFLGVSCRSF